MKRILNVLLPVCVLALMATPALANNTCAATQAAAIDGNYGLEVTLDGSTNNTFVQDNSPNSESVYRASFKVALHTDIVMPNPGNGIYVLTARGSTACDSAGHNNVLRVLARRRTDDPTKYHIIVQVRRDSGSSDNGWYRFPRNIDRATYGGFGIVPGTPIQIEVEWVQATGPGDNNGALRAWKQGNLKIDSAGLNTIALDNDERAICDCKMGMTNFQPQITGFSGHLYFDTFESFRTLAP